MSLEQSLEAYLMDEDAVRTGPTSLEVALELALIARPTPETSEPAEQY